MSKYGNQKVTFDGYNFDSKLEADFYRYLCFLHENELIKYFEVHPTRIVIQEKFEFFGKKINAITYTPDFLVALNNGTFEYIDVKGFKSNEFKIKEKMFKKFLRSKKDYGLYNFYCIQLENEVWRKW